MATETPAIIYIGQQRRLHHLKYTRVHLSGTALSKQEHHCREIITFNHKQRERPFHTNKKSKKGMLLKQNNHLTPHSLNLAPA
jgi:hypothetical protein